jgi:hypothetical protein
MTFEDWLEGKTLGGMELAFAKDAWQSAKREPNCSHCANRGRIYGLSQESFCDHCIYQNQSRENHYAPNALVRGASDGACQD